MIDGDKRCGCGAGHATFGACLRNKSIRLGDVKGEGVSRKWDADLTAYSDARKAGIQPPGIQRSAVDFAVRESQTQGVAFNG